MHTENRRKWWLAGLFSYLVPGLGQIYNGQLIKGSIFHIGLTLWGGVLFGILFPLLHQPVAHGLVVRFFILLAVSIILHWAIIFEAILRAWKQKSEPYAPTSYNKWFIYLSVIVLFSCVNFIETNAIRRYVIKPFRIPTASMAPTLEAGDMLISNQLAFSTHNPERRDVVIFHPPHQRNSYFIKRIIGMPGDSLAIRGGEVVINGVPLDESYAHRDSICPPRGDFGPVVIPMNNYFVLGDSRDNSSDSRDFGPVERQLIVGKPLFIYFSSISGKSLFHRLFAIRFSRIGQIIG